MASTTRTADGVKTRIPARLDRLPWSRFHWFVVLALGITWVLDGLEVTFKGAISGVLQEPGVMGFSPADIGLIASVYLTGAVIGALIFGYLTDQHGRQKLFFITLAVYLGGVLLTAFSAAERHRHHADDHRERRHDHRAEPLEPRVARRVDGAAAARDLVFREAHDEDAVGRRDADAHDRAGQRRHADRRAPAHDRRAAASSAGR